MIITKYWNKSCKIRSIHYSNFTGKLEFTSVKTNGKSNTRIQENQTFIQKSQLETNTEIKLWQQTPTTVNALQDNVSQLTQKLQTLVNLLAESCV